MALERPRLSQCRASLSSCCVGVAGYPPGPQAALPAGLPCLWCHHRQVAGWGWPCCASYVPRSPPPGPSPGEPAGGCSTPQQPWHALPCGQPPRQSFSPERARCRRTLGSAQSSTLRQTPCAGLGPRTGRPARLRSPLPTTRAVLGVLGAASVWKGVRSPRPREPCCQGPTARVGVPSMTLL